MAEEWLEEVYVHSRYITKLKEIIRICQVNNQFEALYQWEKHCQHLADIFNNVSVADDKVKRQIQKIFQLTPQINNCSKVIDLIKCDVLPLMYYLISLYGKIDVSDGERRFLSSRTGYLTVLDERNGKYWHSANDPMEEAYDMAERIYTPKNTEYHVWGGGLGYLAYQIYTLSKDAAKIHIYETDEKILDYGRRYGVLDWIAEEKLVQHHDPRAELFLKSIDEKKRNYYISRPNMRRCQGAEYAGLRRVYLNSGFWLEEEHYLKINLENNLRRKKHLWQDISGEGFENVLVAAAGPSLDQSIDLLRKRTGKLIAVGTVFRKLMGLGIIPDLVVITESKSMVYEQIEGLEDEKVPMLLSPYAYWKIAQNYKGKIYFAQVESLLGEREFCSTNPEEQFQIGGTVSFFAIEAAIHLGAREVGLAGLDLAYPTATTHAEGTARNTAVSTENLYKVQSVNGGQVYTDLPWDLYRQEIEELIRRNPQIKFTNYSGIGAWIKGAYPAGE